jgi:3-dehydroquinate synthase
MHKIKNPHYSIIFKEEMYLFLENILTPEYYSKIFVLVDTNTNEFCLNKFLPEVSTTLEIEIIEIEPGEMHKNLDTCVQLWEVLSDLGADRKSVLINLGGGVVTDMGGFVASTFKRGIDFIHVPTSLLGMVDASVGGKNGIDLGVLKNQIGIIRNPKAVLIDTNFLETLPKQQMRSGLAEMIKHGLIQDENHFHQLKNLNELTSDDLDQLIFDSISIKNNLVEKDPNEKNIRKSLNFGHTLGHAIESYFLNHPHHDMLLHGEAVAIGMILESHIAFQKTLLSHQEFREIVNTIHHIFDKINLSDEDVQMITTYIFHDKKSESGDIKWSLLNGIGQFVINQSVTSKEIELAFEFYKNYEYPN